MYIIYIYTYILSYLYLCMMQVVIDDVLNIFHRWETQRKSPWALKDFPIPATEVELCIAELEVQGQSIN